MNKLYADYVLDTKRRKAADEALADYDFGGTVEATGSWEHEMPGTQWKCRVYMENAVDPDAPSVPLLFIVDFLDTESDLVIGTEDIAL